MPMAGRQAEQGFEADFLPQVCDIGQLLCGGITGKDGYTVLLECFYYQ